MTNLTMTQEQIDTELKWNFQEWKKLTNWKKRGNYVEGVNEVIQDHLDEIKYLMNLDMELNNIII